MSACVWRRWRRSLVLVVLLVAAGTTPGHADAFDDWLQGVRAEAEAQGVRSATLDIVLNGVRPLDRVIELDRRQPEFTQTFWRYLGLRVSDKRIERGRALLVRHADLLAAIERRYGVQPRFLVAFWGLESNFGDHTGNIPLVSSLATLAFDERRARFFRTQLLATLALMDAGDIPLDARGSWAGAMGQTQFLPTTYQAHAVDFDGDGRRDLWASLGDVFASSARYLSDLGWNGERTWGREVRLPDGFDLSVAGLDRRKPLAEWQRLGVRRYDGRDLPTVNIDASLILPGGLGGGPALLVYDNFHKILMWNRSILYAVAVGHLADRLQGGGAFQHPRPAKEVPLSRQEVEEIQRRLAARGFDPGEADGVVGRKTRDAIRAFQKRNQLPADGHPTIGLLERLRLAKN